MLTSAAPGSTCARPGRGANQPMPALLPAGKSQQEQSSLEPSAGVFPHRQREGCQRGGLHQIRTGADRGQRRALGNSKGLPRAGGRGHSATHFFPLTTDTMDFSGLSLIKLKKQEMETQVCTPHAHSCQGLIAGKDPGTHGQCCDGYVACRCESWSWRKH